MLLQGSYDRFVIEIISEIDQITNILIYGAGASGNITYETITNDVKNRMSVHKSGTGSKYVKRKRFKRLLHTIKVENNMLLSGAIQIITYNPVLYSITIYSTCYTTAVK